MKHRSLRRPASVALVAVLLAFLAGGLWWFRSSGPFPVTYHIRLTVCDVRDGTALEGVEVALDTGHHASRHRQGGADARLPASHTVLTNEMGDAELVVHATSDVLRQGGTRWVLTLEKKGYQAETIDISPDPARLPRHLPARVRVVVYLWPEGADRSSGSQ